MKGYENKNSQEVYCHFCFSYKNDFFLSEYIVKKKTFIYDKKAFLDRLKKRSIHYDKLHG